MNPTISTIGWIGFASADAPEPEAEHDLSVLLDAVVGAGFASVGVDAFTLARTGTSPSEAAQAVAAVGLRCSDVGVLRVGREGDLELAVWLASLARALDAPVCVTVLDQPPSAAVVERLRACAEVTAAVGTRMALEFVPYGPLRALGEAVEVCDQVGWDRCGLLLDTWHFFHTGAPWDELRALGGDQLALVQVSDAPDPVTSDLAHESRFRRVPMGEGRLDLDAFGAALRAIDYRGPVSIEVLSTELRQASPAATAVLLREAFDRLTW